MLGMWVWRGKGLFGNEFKVWRDEGMEGRFWAEIEGSNSITQDRRILGGSGVGEAGKV